MLSAAAASLIGAGIGAAGQVVGNVVSNSGNKRSQERAYQYNKQMIEYQNEYNTPANQMRRFAEAGLNPHLIYGQGDAGNQSETAKYQAPSYEMNLGDAASKALTAFATLSNIKTQSAATASNIALQQKQMEGIDSQKDVNESNIRWQTFQQILADKKLPYEVKSLVAQAAMNYAQVENMHSQADLNRQTITQRDELLPYQIRGLHLGNEQSQYQLDVLSPLESSLMEKDLDSKRMGYDQHSIWGIINHRITEIIRKAMKK